MNEDAQILLEAAAQVLADSGMFKAVYDARSLEDAKDCILIHDKDGHVWSVTVEILAQP